MSQGVVQVFGPLLTRTCAPEGSERTTSATTWASPASRGVRGSIPLQAPIDATSSTIVVIRIRTSFLLPDVVAHFDRSLPLLALDAAPRVLLVRRVDLVDDDL